MESLIADFFPDCQIYQKLCFEWLARFSESRQLARDTSEVFSNFLKFPVAIVSESEDEDFFSISRDPISIGHVTQWVRFSHTKSQSLQ